MLGERNANAYNCDVFGDIETVQCALPETSL